MPGNGRLVKRVFGFGAGPAALALWGIHAALAAPTEIAGEVRDAAGPVANAVVRLKGTSHATRSDARGRFRLPRPGLAARVTAAKDGYLIAGADADADPLVLTLRPLPAADCNRYAWVDPTPDPARPQNCGNCHGEIHREWAA